MFSYVASPYTSADKSIVEDRFLKVEEFVANELSKGKWCYSPIVHCHSLAEKFSLPVDFDFWKSYNFAMLSKASEVLVLQLPGWDMSRGVTAEIAMATDLSIPVVLVDPSF